MSIVSFILIFYIVIILFNWLQNQAKKTHILNQKEKSFNRTSVNQDKINSPEYSNNVKDANNVEKNEEIMINDEVKEFYQQKEKKKLTNKPLVMDKEEVIFSEESELSEYLSNNILINGIILSEIIAPPRSLKPYSFKRYKRLGRWMFDNLFEKYELFYYESRDIL